MAACRAGPHHRPERQAAKKPVIGHWGIPNEWIPDYRRSMTTQDIRTAATKRLKAQADVKRTTGVFVIVWFILIGVWFLSGGGYFWPGWAIFGMGIGLAFAFYGAYGPRTTVPTEDQIQQEMKKFGTGTGTD